MIKFIHAADLHLDAPFSALPPDRAQERRAEQRALLGDLTDLVRGRGTDLVLFSGDLFDSGETYAETVRALSEALGRMGVPVFIAPGNHDFYAPRSPYAVERWPENVHIFTEETPCAVPLPNLGCTVYGAAFTAPRSGFAPLAGFSAPAEGGVALMVLHAEVDGRGDYARVTREEIAASGLSYLALGHVHAYSGPRREGNTVWAYPGCPEGRGFDETGEKGVIAGEIDDGGNVSLSFVPLARRRYRIETLDVTGRTPEEALRAFLPPEPSADLVRIVLSGTCGRADLPRLEALAQPWFYSVSLRDRTHIARDIWARAEEDTLTGAFLRDMRAQLAKAEDDETRARVERAVRFGLAALEHGEDPFA